MTATTRPGLATSFREPAIQVRTDEAEPERGRASTVDAAHRVDGARVVRVCGEAQERGEEDTGCDDQGGQQGVVTDFHDVFRLPHHDAVGFFLPVSTTRLAGSFSERRTHRHGSPFALPPMHA